MSRSKRRLKAAKPRAAAPTGKLAAALIVLAVMGAGVAIMTNSQARAPEPVSRIDHGRTAAPRRPAPEIRGEEQRAALGAMLRAATLPEDPEGPELLALHDYGTIYSVLGSNGAILAAETTRVRVASPLLVIVSTREEREANGIIGTEVWQFHAVNGHRMLAPPPETFTDVWGGAVFAHELVHARDIMSGREPPVLPRHDARFIDGEIRAYELEFRLLNRTTGGDFRVAGERILDSRLSDEEGVWTTMPPRTFVPFGELFPPARSVEERATRTGAYIIYLNFLLADRRGLGTEGRRAVLLQMPGFLPHPG